MVVSLVAAAGYVGFRSAGHLNLGTTAGAGVVVLAVVTGFSAFFSPCSFPLLLGLLASSDASTARGQTKSDGFRTAITVGLGATMFFLLVGVLVGIVGEGLARNVGFSTVQGRALRVVVAAVVITAGSVQLGFLKVPFHRLTTLVGPIDSPRVEISSRHSRSSQVLYGFGFVIAAFG